MPTIKDVANLANVSVATVSRVLNTPDKVTISTKNKVEQAVKEIGFVLNASARELVTKATQTIGVVLPQLSDPFFAVIAHTIEQTASGLGHKVLINTGSQNADKELEAINRLRAEGCRTMIVHSRSLTNEKLIELAKEIKGLILLNRYIPELKSRCVWFDNHTGGYLMAQHLYDLGHRKFAMLTSSGESQNESQRLIGIKQFLQEVNITLAPEYIVSTENSFDGGQAAVTELVKRQVDYSALFCFNDQIAIGAISKLNQLGYAVPATISVIGFDDLHFAQFTFPKLTTIKYPIGTMAEKATLLALAFSKDESYFADQSVGYKYPAILIKRDSTTTPVNIKNKINTL